MWEIFGALTLRVVAWALTTDGAVVMQHMLANQGLQAYKAFSGLSVTQIGRHFGYLG
jgi:hypothetical protein